MVEWDPVWAGKWVASRWLGRQLSAAQPEPNQCLCTGAQGKHALAHHLYLQRLKPAKQATAAPTLACATAPAALLRHVLPACLPSKPASALHPHLHLPLPIMHITPPLPVLLLLPLQPDVPLAPWATPACLPACLPACRCA